MIRLLTLWTLAWALLGSAATPALAHKPSDSYLKVSARDDALEGQWDIALRDLDHAIGLDGNDDGSITWGELRARQVHQFRSSLTDCDGGVVSERRH
jgi:hypothetical protein